MKPLRHPKKPVIPDWHKADIKAAIEKRGWTLRRLSAAHGMNTGYLAATLVRPLPRGEAIIAGLLGVKPQEIWPSRYDTDGSPRRGLYRGSYENGCDYLQRTNSSVHPVRNWTKVNRNRAA